jgi:hypothetical protein
MSQNISVFNLRPGGINSALNVTAAGVVAARPGCLSRILVQAPGNAGSLTLNDCLTTGAAAAGNQILSLLYSSLTAGQVITLEWPCLVGIVVSVVPSGGSPIFSISYF